MKELSSFKVAIVCDWLYGGGAERVVQEFHTLFPEAPIYTSYCTDEWRERLGNKVVTGWLQRFGRTRKFMVLGRIWWFSHLDFSEYDLVISSTGNGEAFGIRLPKTTLHICYCHTPTHYYWRHYETYVRHPGFGFFSPLARLGLRLLVGPLRRWDKRAAQRPDYFIANSSHTQADIKKYYGRDSIVIHPPVDIERFSNTPKVDRQGFVTLGRQVPYKRVDIAIKACNELHIPLTVIGRGPEHRHLIKLAGPTVTFLDNVTDRKRPALLASAEAFLFAAHEDFGVSPVEAMACGTPVIAYKAGGALDYVNNVTGLFFDKQTVSSMVNALKQFETMTFDSAAITKFAANFNSNNFDQSLQEFLQQCISSSGVRS